MAEYVDFHYLPLEGKITGKQVLKQTEDAINDLGQHVYEIDIDNELVQEAIDKSEQAINTAESALSAVTVGRSVWFNNVAEMVNSDIETGVVAETKGYYLVNDGGGAVYIIRQKSGGDVVDGGAVIQLADEDMVAQLVTDGEVNVKQFGAMGNGVDDDSTAFQNTSTYAQANGFIAFVALGTYNVTENITGTFNSFGEVTIVGGGTVDIVNLHDIVDDVTAIKEEVDNSTTSAQASATSAATSATNAANSATSAGTALSQLVAYLDTKEEITAPIVDPTLTISGAAADAKVTGDVVKQINRAVAQTGNIVIDGYMQVNNLYINTSNNKFATSTGLSVLVFPIKSDTKYVVSKETVSTMRVGTGSVANPVAGDSMTQSVQITTAGSITVTSGASDTYLYIQLWANADASAMKNNEVHLQSLVIQHPTVDPTLTISGESADAKVTGQIRTDVGITVPTLTLTHGYYVYKDGTLAGGGTQNYDYSAPISVTKGQRVEIVGAGYSTNIAMISTCDADGTNIVPKTISIDSSVHTYEYYVAENGYVMFSFHTPEGYDVSVFDTDSNIVLDKRVSLNEYEITHDLSVPIIDADTFEQGTYSNGSKSATNYGIRFKDGYHVTNPSKVTVVPNGQYTLVSAWYTRTESEGVISFSDRAIPADTWTDQPKEIYVPANCYLLVLVRKTYPTNTNTKPVDNLVQVYVADNQIFKNRADIIDLNDRVTVLEEEVPSYWQTEIARVKTAINTNRLTIGNRIAEFFFITDVHWRLNAQNSITLMNALKKYSGIKTLLVGGDIVCTHTESQITAIEEIREFYQHLNDYRTISTMGNHDFNSNNNSSHPEAYITANQFYSACMSNEELFTNTNASPYVTIYDNESQKVRIIQFYHPDIISIPASVQTEVINAVQEKGTDWTVFMMCHVYWAGGSVDQYITAFTEQLAGLNASGNYAKIGALIVGHMHDDKDTVVDGNLLVIGSNCDIYSQTQGQETMTKGTDTEQSFDVFQVDLANNTIYITRVGAGNDRQFTY